MKIKLFPFLRLPGTTGLPPGIPPMRTPTYHVPPAKVDMCQGISEQLIAKAIKKYNIPREKLVILTKCFFPITDDPLGERIMPDQANSRDYVMKKGTALTLRIGSEILGLSRKHIFEAVEASLKRLEMDYIDVLQIHRYDHDTPREETMKALHGPSTLLPH
jgi:aryl-alcohol dehydrogenase-like predicted oxidoreductase